MVQRICPYMMLKSCGIAKSQCFTCYPAFQAFLLGTVSHCWRNENRGRSTCHGTDPSHDIGDPYHVMGQVCPMTCGGGGVHMSLFGRCRQLSAIFWKFVLFVNVRKKCRSGFNCAPSTWQIPFFLALKNIMKIGCFKGFLIVLWHQQIW